MPAEAQPRHLHNNTSGTLFNKQNYRHIPNKPNILSFRMIPHPIILAIKCPISSTDMHHHRCHQHVQMKTP
eukprot:13582263-Ditylum_brightwellii.AAC.1